MFLISAIFTESRIFRKTTKTNQTLDSSYYGLVNTKLDNYYPWFFLSRRGRAHAFDLIGSQASKKIRETIRPKRQLLPPVSAVERERSS